MVTLAQMRQASGAGVIDAYVSERPVTGLSSLTKFKNDPTSTRFQNWRRRYSYAIDCKDDKFISQINASTKPSLGDEQVALMDQRSKSNLWSSQITE